MTNLANKFASFEEQSATQHTELMNALNSIAYALGSPPATPTITLADIHTQLATIIASLDDNTTRFIGYYNTSLAELGFINNNLDLLINNTSLNAQRMLAAIYATFCECDTTTPLLPAPIDVTPTTLVDEAKCRRIQFYLSVFGNWLNKIGNYGASGAAITGGTLATLLSIAAADAGIVATGAEVGAAAGPPGIVIGAVVGLITVAIYTLGGSVLIDYANQFNDPTLRDNMVQAMYAANNADDGYTAFKTTLLAGMDYLAAEVIYSLWWSAWSNDVYSGTPIVDDSAFDGSICAGEFLATGCWSPTSEQIQSIAITNHWNDAHATYTSVVIWPDDWPTSDGYQGTTGAGTLDVQADLHAKFVLEADIFGYWVRAGGTLYDNNESPLASGSSSVEITVHTTQVFVIGGSTAFQICRENPDL